MSRLLGFLAGGWQGSLACAAIAAVLAASAAVYVTSLGYRITIATMERDTAQGVADANIAALAQFTQDANSIHSAAASFGGIRDDLDAKLSTITRDFRSAIKASPLPVDCKPDAVRLRALSSAIAATNSAAGLQPVPAVPRHP